MSPRPRKKKPEEIGTGPHKPLSLTVEDWQEVEHGIGLFNAGKFWHAHEAWELVWQRQSADERLFFQGLIQLAAAYHHLVTERSRNGYLNNLRKSRAILRVFAPEYIGVRVTPLLGAIEAALEGAGAGTQPEIGDGAAPATGTGGGRPPTSGELSLIPKISFHLPYHPDLVVAIRSATATAAFAEGVELFNGGYHWEAHERWEEVLRDADGEAKNFLQGFVQAAAGMTFLRARKTESAGYLFLKAVETLRQFEEMNCGVQFRPLLDWMAGLLHANGSGAPGLKEEGTETPALALVADGEGSRPG
jgi:predicted metal-dependent hydrolase